MIDTLFSEWSNPEVIAAIVVFRILFNLVIFGNLVISVGVRSGYTAVGGILVAFSTIATVLLLTTNWLGHSVSYIEQLSQILVLVVSAYVVIRVNSDQISGVLLLAWIGAVVLLLAMVPIYGEAFVAP